MPLKFTALTPPPLHAVWLLTALSVGAALTVTLMVSVSVQAPLLAVTVYVVLADGETIRLSFGLPPGNQLMVEPAVAFAMSVSVSPAHKVEVTGATTTVGVVTTPTLTVADAVQLPLAPVTV